MPVSTPSYLYQFRIRIDRQLEWQVTLSRPRCLNRENTFLYVNTVIDNPIMCTRPQEANISNIPTIGGNHAYLIWIIWAYLVLRSVRAAHCTARLADAFM